MSEQSRKKAGLVMEIAALAAVIASAVLLAMKLPDLPDPAPIHYGFDGQPDRWGDPAVLFFLPGAAALIFALLAGARRIPDRFINMPGSGERRSRRIALTRLMLATINLEVALWWVWETHVAISAAISGGNINNITLPVLLGALALTIAGFAIASRRPA